MTSQGSPGECKELFALLSEYLDLELPPEACQQIKDHLAGCPCCIAFTESLRATIELCRQYRPAELPAPMASQFRERLVEAYQRMLADRAPGR